MRKQIEIYLKKATLTREEIEILIKEISYYQGYLKKWKLYVQFEDRKIHLFLELPYDLPTTLDSISFCMFKKIEDKVFFSNTTFIKRPTYIPLDNNIINLYHKLELKKGQHLKTVAITFLPINKEKIYSKTHLYIEKKNQLYQKSLLLSTPTFLLAMDLETEKNFRYQKISKYLNIEKVLPHLHEYKENSLIKIDPFPYSSKDLYLTVDHYDFFRHSLIIGSSGSGKSKFVSLLISKLKKEEYQVVVIDPHAALEKEIGGQPGSRVIDFKTEESSIQLFSATSSDIISSVELMLSLFHNLMIDYYNPKLERVMRNSIYLLLAGKRFNFTNLRNLILDLEYRTTCLKELEESLPQSTLDFFYTDFNELKTKSYMESIAPILSFIDEMQMLPVFQDETKYPDLTEILTFSFLTIFSLDRTKMGDHIIKTIAGFLMQQVLEVVQTKKLHKKLVLVVDEVAVIENPILIRILSEARKYNLSLILIGQYLNQVSPNLKDAIFANTINYYIFRTSRMDATILVDHLNIDLKGEKSKDDRIKLLTNLNNRECIVRISANSKFDSAIKATTLDYIACPYQRKNKSLNKEIEKEENEFCTTWSFSSISLRSILEKLSTNRRWLNDRRKSIRDNR